MRHPSPTRAPLPPIPPRLHDWPVAVRSAALLRGIAVRCGPGIRLVSWPDTPSVRAAAIGDAFTIDRVAAHRTAAWIWGAVRGPGARLSFIVTRGRPNNLGSETGVALHQYRLGASEVVAIGPYAATSPRRTLYDLLRGAEFSNEHRLACRMLLTHAIGSRESSLAELPMRRRPNERRIIARLREL
ncbi:hypothetical protein [Leucobacter sp. GX0328]